MMPTSAFDKKTVVHIASKAIVALGLSCFLSTCVVAAICAAGWCESATEKKLTAIIVSANLLGIGILSLWGPREPVLILGIRKERLRQIWNYLAALVLLLFNVGLWGMIFSFLASLSVVVRGYWTALMAISLSALFSLTIIFVPLLGWQAALPHILRRSYTFVPALLALLVISLKRPFTKKRGGSR